MKQIELADVNYNEIFDNLHNEVDMSNKDVEDLMVIKTPLLRHVHTVTVDKMGVMQCICFEHECMGIFCVC